MSQPSPRRSLRSLAAAALVTGLLPATALADNVEVAISHLLSKLNGLFKFFFSLLIFLSTD